MLARFINCLHACKNAPNRVVYWVDHRSRAGYIFHQSSLQTHLATRLPSLYPSIPL